MTSTSDIHTYTLQISGALEDDFLTSLCPNGTTLTINDHLTILANLRTDQSGIIGIILHLHNLRCTILEVTTKDKS